MTEKEAYRILGLVPGTGIHEIKKRYRQLILTAHPDTGSVRPVHDAQKLNAAYSVLKKGIADSRFPIRERETETAAGQRSEEAYGCMDAPVNSSAYREREILHYAEDQEGTVLGTFCIARGKYLWKVQEDFPLFCSASTVAAPGFLTKWTTPFPVPKLLPAVFPFRQSSPIFLAPAVHRCFSSHTGTCSGNDCRLAGTTGIPFFCHAGIWKESGDRTSRFPFRQTVHSRGTALSICAPQTQAFPEKPGRA